MFGSGETQTRQRQDDGQSGADDFDCVCDEKPQATKELFSYAEMKSK